MWNWVYLIPLAAIGIPLAVIICHYLLKMKRTEVIRAAIEKGEEIPNEVLAWVENEKSEEARKHEKEMALIEKGLYEPYQHHRSLKSGIIVSSLGVAFTIFSIVVLRSEYFLDDNAVWAFLLAGLILLFLGAGLIVFHYLTLREGKHNSVDEGQNNSVP